MAFGVEQTWVGRTAVLSVRGDIDALTAPQLTEKILDVSAEQPSVMIIDLSAVEFLASAGITVLVSAHEYVTSKVNAGFAVVADGPTTSRPLKLMSIDSIIRLFPQLQDALEANADS
ncbi:STAS domain-containing protein [Mycolicibacterium komossense]|uniref:STAS domain-containing protein n=1 Tax=Mycolicibacterium komossense TaxID=1779 RepID=UPI0021F3661D|nr:STAS domain-containing protein [Mycolicibacterium komossense]